MSNSLSRGFGISTLAQPDDAGIGDCELKHSSASAMFKMLGDRREAAINVTCTRPRK